MTITNKKTTTKSATKKEAVRKRKPRKTVSKKGATAQPAQSTILLKDPNKITRAHIDKACEHIKNCHIEQQAFILAGLEPKAVWDLMNRPGPKQKQLSLETHDLIKKARAEMEEMLLEKIRNTKEYHSGISTAIQNFMTMVVPRYNKTVNKHRYYETEILLDKAQNALPEEWYEVLLEAFKDEDGQTLVENMDYKLSDQIQPTKGRKK